MKKLNVYDYISSCESRITAMLDGEKRNYRLIHSDSEILTDVSSADLFKIISSVVMHAFKCMESGELTVSLEKLQLTADQKDFRQIGLAEGNYCIIVFSEKTEALKISRTQLTSANNSTVRSIDDIINKNGGRIRLTAILQNVQEFKIILPCL